MDLEGLMPLLSIVSTLVIGLIAEIIRQRKALGDAKSDPITFALRKVVDAFTYQDDSLYYMSLLSKFMKNLVKYLTLLASNGEDVLTSEIQRMTEELQVNITRLEGRIDLRNLSASEKQVLKELKLLLDRRAPEESS